MILRLLIVGFLVLPLAALADSVTDSMRQLDDINKILNGQTFDKSCWMDPSETGKSCNKTSDEFCRKLWDEGDGNLAVFDGKVRAGSSDVSGLSLPQLDDYNALVGALPRLPKDLAVKAGPPLKKLKALLKTENDSNQWKRDVADSFRKFQEAEEDVKAAREKKKSKATTTLEQEVVNAKYAGSANWKRVERLFPQVKEDLIKTIDNLSISEERKQHMKERVRTVSLTLPNGTDDCGTTQVNAFYTLETHKFTVCAGLFNAYATDSGLYQTIAHEISHSIDNNAEADADFHRKSAIAAALQPLVGAKGPALPCDKWDSIQRGVISTPMTTVPKSELDPFYACLEPRTSLKTLTPALSHDLADIEARKAMSKLSAAHSFLKLAQPTFTEQGELKPNPDFLRPDLVETGDDDDTSKIINLGKSKQAKTQKGKDQEGEPPPRADANTAEIFTQVLACQKPTTPPGGGEEAAASDERFPKVTDASQRRAMFRAALEQTSAIIQRRKVDEFSYCGQSCSDLVASGYSKDPSESFADWLANRSLRFLYARVNGAENRQESAALGNALLCDEAGPKRDAPGLAAEEKKFSTEEHPDDRTRRISEYDGFVAHQLGCTLSQNQGFAPCEP